MKRRQQCVKVGDTIVYRRSTDNSIHHGKVIDVVLTEYPGASLGTQATRASFNAVEADMVIFKLDTGTWCHGRQVIGI